MKKKPTGQNLLVLVVLAGAFVAMLASIKPWARDTIKWSNNLPEALALSKQTGRPVFVDFYADWCGPCKEMERQTYTDGGVQKLIETAIPVKINIDKQPKIAGEYNTAAIPYVALLDGKGKVLKDSAGYMDPGTFKEFWKAPNDGASSHTSLFQ